MSRKDWTTGEEKRLIEIYQRFDVIGCSMVMGRTIRSIMGRAEMLGIKSPRANIGYKRRFFAEDMANIFELMQMGFDCESIAKCFNCNLATVGRVIRDAKMNGLANFPKRGD